MSEEHHQKKVEAIELQMKLLLSEKREKGMPLRMALQYGSHHSNTTRTKSYNNGASAQIDLSDFNHIVRIDLEKKTIIVEPRVTMEALVQATLLHGLMVPIIPEFKGITVGGAILGGATESSAHKWGLFNDICLSYEILRGDGQVIHASPFLNPDVFYGIAGSYGSLGTLLSAEIQLVPAYESVFLKYHVFTKSTDALEFMSQRTHAWDAPDFLDGLVFSKKLFIVIQGIGQLKQEAKSLIPYFSMKSPSAEWYYQHVEKKAQETLEPYFEERMSLQEYIFRYDRGAFWMGSYLFSFPFFSRFLLEGLLKVRKPTPLDLGIDEYKRRNEISGPNSFLRTIFRPFLSSQRLWGLLHKAEKWVQNRTVIQDFCIPESNAPYFLEEVLQEIELFPLWLVPIKGTRDKQIFSPNLLSDKKETTHFINIGMYGKPFVSQDIPSLTRSLEYKTSKYGGRKVLYSRSYYSREEFWHIYSHAAYEELRETMHANGVFRDIPEKVLSE